MEGFEGNEARLGAQMSLNAPGAVRAGADGLQLLSERDYIYSDYYRPKYAIRQGLWPLVCVALAMRHTLTVLLQRNWEGGA